ncbi:hypothetical protein LIER_39624 [Lithospermum erythrorhizon]|uniref:Uncharacterized protein n=1 Tax=Lithospermum erythrorhizon TaxID=34254 RepID=A0AAV3QN97_LITER
MVAADSSSTKRSHSLLSLNSATHRSTSASTCLRRVSAFEEQTSAVSALFVAATMAERESSTSFAKEAWSLLSFSRSASRWIAHPWHCSALRLSPSRRLERIPMPPASSQRKFLSSPLGEQQLIEH